MYFILTYKKFYESKRAFCACLDKITTKKTRGEYMQKYKLFENKNDLRPYAVFVYVQHTTGCAFWQQISKNYFYKGCALRFMQKLQQQ
jgi:hypothetical protein